jgi:stress-induced morphogen
MVTIRQMLQLAVGLKVELDYSPFYSELQKALRMADVIEIKTRIEQALPGSTAEVVDTAGDNNHFRAVVTAPQFEGLSRIQQHKMINEVFEGELGHNIHALSIKTQTP